MTMVVTLSACERRVVEPQANARAPLTPSQRFFAGQALPGEFLTLKDLPPVPASFDESQP
ncbi:hypothetical protein [Pseudomonas sp. YJ42]|uniref:hypothetical protein n=1 Tax=Pseudomonas sp. YJ42 TaxID=3392115 RepID=UPI00399FBF8A